MFTLTHFKMQFAMVLLIGGFCAIAQAQDDCKAVHGLIVEGTGVADDTAEEMFQRITAQWGDAYADLSDSVSVVPSTNRGQFLQRANQKKLAALSELIHQTPADKMCEGDIIPFAFMKMALGKMNETIEVLPEDITSYRHEGIDLSARNNVNIEKNITLKHLRAPRLPSGPGSVGSGGSMGSPGTVGQAEAPPRSGFDQSKLLSKIRDRKARCGDKADQVVMINLASHGSEDCKFLMNFDERLTAEDVRKQLIEPLAEEGVKVVLNFSNCYGGCFVDQLKDLKLPAGSCFTSASRSTTVAYGADGIVSNTYDETYPQYLRKLKNPLKAHLCATLWDPMNEPQASGSAPKPTQSRSGNRLDGVRAETAESIGRKLGFPTLAQDCTPPDSSGSRMLPGIPEEKLKAIFNCPKVQKGFETSGSGGDMKLFVSATANPNSAPGLDSLKKLAENPAALKGLTDGCDINLASYPQKVPLRSTGNPSTTPTPKKSKTIK